MERKPEITAANIAQDYFRRELVAHEKLETSSKTMVIIRDSCYGHRYSRPRTSKAALNTIVERPERLHACVLGASTAYVRIGGRHAGGSSPPHPNQDVPRPPFKIQKTTRSVPLNYSAVTQVHGQKWMEELQIMCDSAEGKLAMNGRELVRPIGYGKDEAGNPLPKLHEGDLYLCSESLDALQGCLGGVCEAVDAVFSPGDISRAFVCIRPPGHHCSSNFPSGFCWLNNVHVGIAHAAMNQGLTHAAIIDFDLHHGDGSQAIAWDHNRKAAGSLPKNASPYSKIPIGYFSLHDINSYPCEWGDEEKIKNASLCVENAHGQSIWNVHLEPWKNHTDFWKLYESRYSILLDKTRMFLRQHTTRLEGANNGTKTKAAIFLSAGFDASEWEGAGMQRHKVNVPTDFYARFTSDVVKLADEEGLGVDGRIVSVLEGGYSDRALTSGVLSHLCGLTSDSSHASPKAETVDTSLAAAMAKQMGMLDRTGHTSSTTGEKPTVERDSAAKILYDPEWWNTPQLEALEALVNPAPVPSAHLRSKDKMAGNYSSPTQASAAKVMELARERRSLSGRAEGRLSVEPEYSQPWPDVDWTVASFELSRILIPNDRQTLSCRHDELNSEATKVRRDRQSAVGLPSNDPSAVDQRMQLRDRKAKAPTGEELIKGVSKTDRRRTIAAVADLPDPNALQNGGNKPVVGIANNRPRRRSSDGSSIMSAFQSMNLDDHDSQHSEAAVVIDRGENIPKYDKGRILPGKTDKAPVQRKVRQPTAKAPSTKAKTSPRKTGPTPPVPKVPSAFVRSSSYASNGGQEITSAQAQPASERTDSATSLNKADDLDALSSVMKKMKINLKVPSQEENAAREKMAAVEKERQKKARAPRKPTVPKAPKIGPTKSTRQPTNINAIPLSTPDVSAAEKQYRIPVDTSSPIVPSEQQPQPSQSAEKSGPADYYTPTSDIAHAEPPLNATIAAPVLLPMEMESMPSIDQTGEELSASYLPPTSPTSAEPILSSHLSQPHPQRNNPSQQSFSFSTAIPTSAPATIRKTRVDLPQFTASSPIPFAKNDPNAASYTQLVREEDDLECEVPPPSLTQDAGGLGIQTDLQQQQQQQQRQTQENVAAENDPPIPIQPPVSKASAVDSMVWEVPETPRH